MEQRYIKLIGDSFGFTSSAIHNITDMDKPISDVIYDRFFVEQSNGKQLAINNINGSTFEEIFKVLEG